MRSSSGDKALDQAALKILRLAAPFDPLPANVRKDYDVLRFAYEWDFFDGARRAAVGASPTNRLARRPLILAAENARIALQFEPEPEPPCGRCKITS